MKYSICRKFIEILTMTTEDWNDCGNSGVALNETERKAKLSSRICNGLIILRTMGVLAYVMGIVLADADVTDRTAELPLMLKMEYPFVIDTQRKYRLVLASQFVFVMVCGWGAVLFNALFLTLVTCTYMSKYYKQNIIIFIINVPLQIICINIRL